MNAIHDLNLGGIDDLAPCSSFHDVNLGVHYEELDETGHSVVSLDGEEFAGCLACKPGADGWVLVEGEEGEFLICGSVICWVVLTYLCVPDE